MCQKMEIRLHCYTCNKGWNKHVGEQHDGKNRTRKGIRFFKWNLKKCDTFFQCSGMYLFLIDVTYIPSRVKQWDMYNHHSNVNNQNTFKILCGVNQFRFYRNVRETDRQTLYFLEDYRPIEQCWNSAVDGTLFWLTCCSNW